MSFHKLPFYEYIVFPKLVSCSEPWPWPCILLKEKEIQSSFILSFVLSCFSLDFTYERPGGVCKTMVALLLLVHSEKQKVKGVQRVH